jgi:hypothetical protein
VLIISIPLQRRGIPDFSTQETGEFSIFSGSVSSITKPKIEQIGKSIYEMATICCHDMGRDSIGVLTSVPAVERKAFFKSLAKLSPKRPKWETLSMSFKGDNQLSEHGWITVDMLAELRRQGVNLENWRESNRNVEYRLSLYYPETILARTNFEDRDLMSLANNNRWPARKIPVITWGNPNGGMLIRCEALQVLDEPW